MDTFGSILLWIVYTVSLYFAVFWFIVFLTEDNKLRRRRLTEFPSVTVAIPAYNEEEVIAETIGAVLELDYPKEMLEIIIVDDGSGDNTLEEVRSVINKHPGYDIKLITQRNMGKGAALNKALDAASGEYFVCLDADSRVRKSALKKALPYFVNDGIAAVLPSLKVEGPKNFIQKLQWYEYIVNMFYKELMAKLDCVHVAPGPFSIYKTDIIKNVGRFDENRNLTEDLEIALRLQSRHYKIVQILNAEVFTVAPKTIKELYRQRNRWYKGSLINAFRYRKMLLNSRFGDFGMIQMPTLFIFGFIAIISALTLTYYAFKPYVLYFHNISLVNFDFLVFLKDITPNFHFLDFDYVNILIAIAMLCITTTVMIKSHVVTGERIKKHGLLPMISFIFFYYIVLGYMWLGICLDFLRKKKHEW